MAFYCRFRQEPPGHQGAKAIGPSTVLYVTCTKVPRGSSYTADMELGLKSHVWYSFWDLLPRRHCSTAAL